MNWTAVAIAVLILGGWVVSALIANRIRREGDANTAFGIVLASSCMACLLAAVVMILF